MENNTVVPTAEVVDVQENVTSRYHEDDFLNELYARMKQHNQDTSKLHSRVGDTGDAPGTIYTLTGELGLGEIRNDNNVVTGVYPAFRTVQGKLISVKQLMCPSNLDGYIFDNTSEYIHKFNDANGQTQTKKVKSNIMANFLTEDGRPGLYNKPEERIFEDYILFIRQNPSKFANKSCQYIGKAIKPYQSSKPGSFSGESWEAGWDRVMETKLWRIL